MKTVNNKTNEIFTLYEKLISLLDNLHEYQKDADEETLLTLTKSW